MARQRVRDRRPRKRVDDVATLDKEYVEQMEAAEKAESSEAGLAESPAAEDAAAESARQEVSPPDPDEGSHVFGEQGKAWMAVDLGMGYIEGEPSKYDEQVLETFGLDEAKLTKLKETLNEFIVPEIKAMVGKCL